MFFDKWYVSYSGFKQDFARDFALNLNLDIFGKLSRKCTPEDKDNLDNLLAKLFADNSNCDNWFILLENLYQASLYTEYNKFIPKQSNPNPELDKMDIFVGYYPVRDKKVPVFRVCGRKETRKIFF